MIDVRVGCKSTMAATVETAAKTALKGGEIQSLRSTEAREGGSCKPPSKPDPHPAEGEQQLLIFIRRIFQPHLQPHIDS